MPKKYYPVSFKVDDIDYTANLLDVDLQELLAIFQSGFDPNIPSTLVSRTKLREVERFLNDSGVTPALPDLAKHSDFTDRMNLFKAIGAVQLESLKDTVPDWENAITPEQLQLLQEYKDALGVALISSDDETLIKDNAIRLQTQCLQT